MALVTRLLATWRSPGATVAAMRGLSDPAMLALLIATLALYFVAQWPGLAREAALDPAVPLEPRLAGALFATLFLMPLIVMAVAGLVSLVIRLAGAHLSGPDSRLALIWALAAVTPAMLLAGLAQGLAGPGPALTLVRLGAGLAFVTFWIAGLRRFAIRKRGIA